MTEVAGIVLHRIMMPSRTRNADVAANEDIDDQSAMTTRMKRCAMMLIVTTHAPRHQTHGANHRTATETKTATPQAPSTAHPTGPIAIVTKNQTPNNNTKTNILLAAETNPATVIFRRRPKAEAAVTVTVSTTTGAATPAATTTKTETETEIVIVIATEKTDTVTVKDLAVTATPTNPQTPKQKILTATVPAATNANIYLNPNLLATAAAPPPLPSETETATANPAEGPPPPK